MSTKEPWSQEETPLTDAAEYAYSMDPSQTKVVESCHVRAIERRLRHARRLLQGMLAWEWIERVDDDMIEMVDAHLDDIE